MANLNFNKFSLRTRIVVFAVSVELIMLTLLVWNTSRETRYQLVSQAVENARKTAEQLRAGISSALQSKNHRLIRNRISKTCRVQKYSFVSVHDRHGNLVVRHDHSDQAVTGKGSHTRTVIVPLARNTNRIGEIRIGVNLRQISKAVTAVRQQGTLIAGIEITLSVIILSLIAWSLTRNVSRLTESVKRIQSGSPDPVEINSEDEFGKLAEAFNRLQLALADREAAHHKTMADLQQREGDLRAMAENANEGILVNYQGKHVFCNQKIADMLGYTIDELHETGINEVVHPEEVELVRNRFTHRMQGGDEPVVYETRMITKESKPVDVELIAARTSWHGQPAGMVFVRDITGRKQQEAELARYREHLEELVEQRAGALEIANLELESFSYSVSHDLRAPLRSIEGFSRLLLDEYHQKLDVEGRDYLERVRSAARRMSVLIDDMLNLARINRHEMKLSDVDLSALADKSANRYRELEPERDVSFTAEPGIVARGDASLLEIVMDNLVSNAWKYTSKSDHATVHFGMEMQNGEPVYFIEDNGIGFDMEFAKRIFKPFERLHPAREFEGSGVGLATVERIIKRHQGKIWADSEPGEKTRISFQLDASVRE